MDSTIFPPTQQVPLTCPQCGAIDVPLISMGAGPHAACARCRHCGRFLRWLSQYTPEERQARREAARQQAMAKRPPSEKQILFLQSLGDTRPAPATMDAASSRITVLKAVRS